MSSAVVTYRYPNGAKEYRLGEQAAPLVGELLRRGDKLWAVKHVRQNRDGSALVTLVPFKPPGA